MHIGSYRDTYDLGLVGGRKLCQPRILSSGKYRNPLLSFASLPLDITRTSQGNTAHAQLLRHHHWCARFKQMW